MLHAYLYARHCEPERSEGVAIFNVTSITIIIGKNKKKPGGFKEKFGG